MEEFEHTIAHFLNFLSFDRKNVERIRNFIKIDILIIRLLFLSFVLCICLLFAVVYFEKFGDLYDMI